MIDEGNPFDVVFAGKRQKTPVPAASGDLMSTLRQAGFKGEALNTAYAVSKAESGWNPRAHNPNAATGDNSYGLFQINMLGNLGPARRSQFGLQSNEELYDPLTNAKIAYRMSGGGKNWSPWSAYKSGAYEKYLPKGGIQDVPLATGPAPVKQLPLAQGMSMENNPFSVVFERNRQNPFQSSLADSPFAGVVASRPAQSVIPSMVPEKTGDLMNWVGKVEHRQGPSRAHTPAILRFVGKVGQTYGEVLTPWGNESHSLTTVNGNRSAHADGRAADIPAAGAELVNKGRAALIAAGADPAWARKQTGGLFNIGNYQVIFNTHVGGDHTDHVHVGLRG